MGARFSYRGLPPEKVASLRLSADRIRQTVTDIGRELVTAKKLLPHGQFLKWVKLETGLEERTAQRAMLAFKAAQKNDKLSGLQRSVLYTVAAPSTAPQVIHLVAEKADAGETVRHVDIVSFKRAAEHDASADISADIHRIVHERQENMRAIVALLVDNLSDDDLAAFVKLCRAADSAETLHSLARRIEESRGSRRALLIN